jgi:hypothetical protein
MLQILLGSLNQISDWRGTSGKPGEFVNIIVQELILDELGSYFLQYLVNYCPREEQRRRVGSGEKGHIDGNNDSKPLKYFDPQRARVEPCMTQPDDLSSDLF